MLRRLVARSGEPVVRQAVTAAMRILGAPVRHGPHHRGGAGARRAGARRRAIAIPTTCWARRRAPPPTRERYARALSRRRSPPSARASARPRPRRRRRASRSSSRRSIRATRKRSASACWRELLPRLLALAAPGAGRRHRPHHRRRGGRPARPLARSLRRRWPPSRRSPAGTGSAWRCRPIRSARCRSSTGSPTWRGATERRLMVRLVKGAYWDSEIKRAPGARARRLSRSSPASSRPTSPTSPAPSGCSAARDAFFPQFATHNAHTRGGRARARRRRARLRVPAPARHGRGALRPDRRHAPAQCPCRVYAPVGGHEDLLAYLVRRLLENGANTSFVNRLVDERAPVDEHRRRSGRAARARSRRSRIRASRCRAISMAPSAAIRAGSISPIRAARRLRACADARGERRLDARRRSIGGDAAPRRGARPCAIPPTAAASSARSSRPTRATIDARAGARPPRAAPRWDGTPAAERARCLERAADLIEARMPELMALIVREGGQDPRRRARRGARGGRSSAATTRAARARRLRRAADAAGPDRRAQPAGAARARRLRLHLAVEFPARDLHRPGRGGARRRQRGDRQARRADAAGRRRRRAAAARGRRPGRRAAAAARRRADASAPRWSPIRASPASPSPARPRRRARINAGAGRARRADRAVHRRDRRPERADRRFDARCPSRWSPT